MPSSRRHSFPRLLSPAHIWSLSLLLLSLPARPLPAYTVSEAAKAFRLLVPPPLLALAQMLMHHTLPNGTPPTNTTSYHLLLIMSRAPFSVSLTDAPLVLYPA